MLPTNNIIIKSLKNIYKYFKIVYDFLSLPFMIITLVIAINALDVSKKAIEISEIQFKQNSKSSDSLFNLQLNNSRILNDSLIIQIRDLQKITNAQLQITADQLKNSKQALKAQIYAGRPNIVIDENKITDTDIKNSIFRPKITIVFKNYGTRYAYNVTIRTFLIFGEIPDIIIDEKTFSILEQNVPYEHHCTQTINLKYKNDFFCVYEISYFDKYSKDKYSEVYYQHFTKMNDIFNFWICNKEKASYLKDVINKYLKSKNIPLFDK